ncbi:MAG: MarR family transcriptional regulator [Candidimonas sp.]|nr:MAG: MarR family transcriptional regulator [Candidimonas sp.]TAM23586.1 MAG: MarR family transcriptional regulator [Candidimonas sp.]
MIDYYVPLSNSILTKVFYLSMSKRGTTMSIEIIRRTVARAELLGEDGDDIGFRRMLYDLFAFSDSLTEARGLFAGYIGLSPIQYQILIVVSHTPPNDSTVGVAQVAEQLRVSGTFITTESNKLVKLDLLEKARHPNDRRRVCLAVTKEGLRRLEHLAALQRPINDALFGTLTRKEFQHLSDMMRRLAQGSTQAIHLASHLVEQNNEIQA